MNDRAGDRDRSDVERRWIVGVDGSTCSRRAAAWASTNAVGRASGLTLAMAWDVPASVVMSPMAGLATATRSLEEAAALTIADVAEEVRQNARLPVTTTVDRGGAAAVLLDASRDADLLVVGCRGRGGFARLALGSTSTQCATHAHVPVAVIPATASDERAMSMMVAIDGSPNSMCAASWAMEFASAGASITCVSVWDPDAVYETADQAVLKKWTEWAAARFDDLVSDMRQRHPRDDVELHQEFVVGNPRASLRNRSESCDLLVVGARGHGALGAAVLGSVSTWLLHHSGRPMIVVPADGNEVPHAL